VALDRIEYGRAMGKGRGKGFGAVLVVLAALSWGAALVPLRAGATDSDLKHAFAFRIEASDGYEILAFAASQSADGRGEIALIVHRRNAGAFYVAPATVTARRIEADLGRLGGVALDVAPSGKTRRLRSRCGAKPRAVSFEPPSYRGRFEFHGEEGYVDATSAAPRDYTRFFLELVCGGVGSGETSGATLPGARLRLHSHQGSFRLNLQANKNRPGARTRLEVETHEMRQGIAISRSRTMWAGAGAFGYDRSLNTATLAPPPPFSGRGRFRRDAAAAYPWTGNLTVDLPGRSDVPLTGARIDATLAPACWNEGKGHVRC
jgi:hypothetical protein